jgi:DNA primase
MSVIDEIKARVDIVDLVSETVKLRRSGKNYVGFCPFHANTRTPAFVVFPESGTWRCFGECNEGGDIFKFVMKREGWDFPEALHALAQRAGVELEPPSPQRQAAEEAQDRLRDLLGQAALFYQQQLLHAAAGQEALAYLRKRGVSDASIEAFGLGYAPNAWDATLQHFTQQGTKVGDLLQAGLVVEREGGGYYDRFRDRITFPIRDEQGRMAGFGARVLQPDQLPKFVNSPQTVLFDKGKLLYGLDLARKAMRAQDQAVIVEGYLDVILVHQSGFENVVSPMGTALTEDQVRLLKRFTKHIVLALDPDAAGEKATLRGLELARQALDHTSELVFDARGLLRQEARLEADLRVVTLPAGEDPDEVVLRDPAEWQGLVRSARPIIEHVMQTLVGEQNVDDPKVKSEVARRVFPLIQDVPDAVERNVYQQRLARLLRVDEEALMALAASVQAAPRQVRAARRWRPAEQQAPEPEEAPARAARRFAPANGQDTQALRQRTCLRLLLQRPELSFWLDRRLEKNGLDRFGPQDFENAEYQLLAGLLLAGQEENPGDALAYVREKAPEDLHDLLEQLLAPDGQPEEDPGREAEELLRLVLNLRRARVTQAIDQLRFLQEDTENGTTASDGPFPQRALGLALTRGRLDLALHESVEPLDPD